MKDFLAMVTVYYVGEYLFLSKYTTWILHTILLTAWMFIEDSLFSWHKTCCVWRHIKIVLDHHIFCLVNQCAEKKNYNNFWTSIVRLMVKIDKINRYFFFFVWIHIYSQARQQVLYKKDTTLDTDFFGVKNIFGEIPWSERKKIINSRKNFENKYPQTGFVDNFPVEAHWSLS